MRLHFTDTIVSLLAIGLVSAGCNSGCSDSEQTPAVVGDRSNEAPDAHAHWSYDGESGSTHWGTLDEAWATCGTGLAQSPVDLASKITLEDLEDLTLSYGSSAVSIVNNGHTIQYNYDAGSRLKVGEKTYQLLQFHFHAHSEHTVEGTAYPMEMHLVHADDDGQLAVLGVFIEEGDEQEALANAGWDALPQVTDETLVNASRTIDASALVPGGVTWRYDGSLTTPPCSESVAWHVFATPISLSAAQIGAFTAIFDHNYRPTESLNGRVVSRGE